MGRSKVIAGGVNLSIFDPMESLAGPAVREQVEHDREAVAHRAVFQAVGQAEDKSRPGKPR